MRRLKAPVSTGLRALTTSRALSPTMVPPVDLDVMGDRLRHAGDLAGAERAYLASVEAAGSDQQLIQSALALENGDLPTAETILRSKLRQQPTSLAAIRLMAMLAVRVARYDDAVALCSRALSLAPSFQPARELRARTLHRMNRFAEALSDVDTLLGGDPANASLSMLRAALLVRLGRQQDAAEEYANALQHHPDNPTGWLSLGHVLKAIGRVDDAIKAYRRALQTREVFGEAWWSLANLKTFAFDTGDIDSMSHALDRTDDQNDRLHLHFALGKAFEDRDERARAYQHYASGNELRKAQLDYCPDKTTLWVDDIINSGAGACKSVYRSPPPASAGPIFVVGLPRSGSTLVEQILASHSAVEGTSELPAMMMIGERLRHRADGSKLELGQLIAALTAEEGASLSQGYLEHSLSHRHTARPFFIDKMPNNWLHIALINTLFPHAPIIDVRRSPMAVGWAVFKQHFAKGQEFSYDQRHIARYYADYSRMISFFDTHYPGRVHTLIYEELVDDTERQVRALLDRLSLPFEPGCLSFWANDRIVRTPSSEQVRQPIYRSGLDHWMKYENWLQPMQEEFKRLGCGL